MEIEKDLHRTIRPSESKDFKSMLSRARILKSGQERTKPAFDVHYRGDNFKVFPPGKDKETNGGLSVWSEHNTKWVIENSPQWDNIEDSLTKTRTNGDFVGIPRFFCYQIKKGLKLPQAYSIQQKENNPIGYNLYPREEIKLENVHKRKVGKREEITWSGEFPGIANLDWERCCIILKPKDEETYNWMKGNGPEPILKTHKDPDCEAVIRAIEEVLLSYDFDELDVAYQTIDWINEQECFDDLKNLSKDYTRIISFGLQETMLNCHPDDSEYFFPVWQKFSKIETEIEKILDTKKIC